MNGKPDERLENNMDSRKKRWGVNQWAAFFENQALPVMRRSKLLLTQLQEAEGEQLSAKELSDITLLDPMLCMCLLREAERRKSHRLDHETTTALAAIMQLGVDEFRHLLLSSPEVDEGRNELHVLESRANVASQIAQAWATGRLDMNPQEVAVAALLADAGELLLWVYEPEVAQKAADELASGRAKRSSQAQLQSCGFTFKELTLRCAELWKLPSLVIQLLHGADTPRAQLTRICSNAARHVLDATPSATLALATDLVEVHTLIPSVSLEWLLDGVAMLSFDRRDAVLETAQGLLPDCSVGER